MVCQHAERAFVTVNLIEDVDATIAVSGTLAGIVHSIEGILAEWLDKLWSKDDIEVCLYLRVSGVGISSARVLLVVWSG